MHKLIPYKFATFADARTAQHLRRPHSSKYNKRTNFVRFEVHKRRERFALAHLEPTRVLVWVVGPWARALSTHGLTTRVNQYVIYCFTILFG
jgi:hypothetical protein